MTRRRLVGRGLLLAGASALGPSVLLGCGREPAPAPRPVGFGPLVVDPNGVLDLPRGFRYAVVSEEGDELSGGGRVPGHHDGMAAFPAGGGGTVLVRNHELSGDGGGAVDGRRPYDADEPGGTTTVLVGPDRRRVDEFASLSGTRLNCAGGRTPWGTWLTCEEDTSDGHGYVFEVVPFEREGGLARRPLRDLGTFAHEAVAIDPRTGIIYLTEDDARGVTPEPGQALTSFLYRFVPADRSGRPGSLAAGGRLEALSLAEGPGQRSSGVPAARPAEVVWTEVRADDAHADAQAKGAVRFNRLEGADFSGGALWFSDTIGGAAGLGQVFRYRPAPNTLELFLESAEPGRASAPDNLMTAPWGDLWFAEDHDGGRNRIVGVTPEGRGYEFARYAGGESELAGPCFAPDGRTFFVNVYSPGATLAVWGPFAPGASARRDAMARAAPPAGGGPRVTPELAEAAARRGLGALEAAAFERLGVPLA